MEGTAPVDTDVLVELTRDPNILVVVGMAHPPRPGVRKFSMKLEYEHFDPFDEQLNNKFQLVFSSWEGMKFMLMIVPMSDKHKCESVAKECGLRLADGIPMVITAEGTKKFFLEGNNVFTLEQEKGSPLYSGGMDKMLADEERDMQAMMRAQEARLDSN